MGQPFCVLVEATYGRVTIFGKVLCEDPTIYRPFQTAKCNSNTDPMCSAQFPMVPLCVGAQVLRSVELGVHESLVVGTRELAPSRRPPYLSRNT